MDEMETNSRLPKLQETQIRELLRFVNRNKQGFCSYKEILIQTFGPVKGEQLFLTDKSALEAELKDASRQRSSRFVMPQQVNNPANRDLGELGNSMIMSGQNYEDAIKIALGPNANPELKITREQLFGMLSSINVDPNPFNRALSFWLE